MRDMRQATGGAAGRRRSGSLLPAVLLASFLLPGMAGAQGMRAAYQAHVGGMSPLKGQAELVMEAGRYSLRIDAETDGFVGRLLSWQSRVTSLGTLARGVPRPELYELSSLWRGEPRDVTLRYDARGGVQVTAVPPPEEDEREPVPDELQRGTLDPVTAMLAVMLGAAEGRGCAGTMPVYDGRRRYDMVFADLGMDRIAPSGYSAFSGAARRCQVTYKPIAGYSRKPPPSLMGQRLFARSEGDGEPRPPVEVWFAPVTEGGPPVPVRIETESGLGGVVVHLTGASPLPRPASAAGTRPAARP